MRVPFRPCKTRQKNLKFIARSPAGIIIGRDILGIGFGSHIGFPWVLLMLENRSNPKFFKIKNLNPKISK